MTNMTVTVVNTAGIQSYIFGSNRLRENIGASELVYRSTTQWVVETLDTVTQNTVGHNAKFIEAAIQYDESGKTIEAGDYAAELLYAGGGNAVILFNTEQHPEIAKAFATELTLRTLQEAPGLPLYVAHRPHKWQKGEKPEEPLPTTIRHAFRHIEDQRSEQSPHTPQMGLSVTVQGQSTNLPANQQDKLDGVWTPISWQVDAKERANKTLADARLQGLFPFVTDKDAPGTSFAWSSELDEICNLTENESYLAVVHADGNGMGQRILALNKLFEKEAFASARRPFIRAIRQLSQTFQKTAKTALRVTVEALYERLQHLDDNDKPPYNIIKGKAIFPLRPIVFGGDDVTLACAGPWGLEIAHHYLEQLEQGEVLPSIAELLDGMDPSQIKDAEAKFAKLSKLETASQAPYACAGVAIVKTHYPFARAYDMSEALVKSAKQRVKTFSKTKQGSAIDWHLTTTGLNDGLAEIRAREYHTAAGLNLTARPLMLHPTRTWRNWHNFQAMRQLFTGRDWAKQHNKLLALREAIRFGPSGVQQFETIRQIKLPTIVPPPQFEMAGMSEPVPQPFQFTGGWVTLTPEAQATDQNGASDALNDEVRGAYFDAIEIHKLYFTLELEETHA